jgi:hypothetical protein
MDKLVNSSLIRSIAVAIALTLILFSSDAVAQIRPTIIDPGEVKETRPQVVRIDRSRVGSTKATRPNNTVLIILTEPKQAEITINGTPAGKANNGKFQREYPSGRQLSIEVSAGPEYQPFSKVVRLRPREPEIIEAALTSKYGVVKIFPALDGVKILVDDQPVLPEKMQVDKENRTITIEGLTPGEHLVKYDHPEYVLYQRKFRISPGSEQSWNFIPERAVVAMTVLTEPDTTVYIDGEQMGRTPADGKLTRSDVRIGQHEVKLSKEDYYEFKKTLSFEFGKPVRLEQRLVPLPTSAEFNDDFDVPNPKRWTMPGSGVSIKEGRLILDKTSGLVFPTDIRYRDFVMHFHLRLSNAAGASWAVRVKDSNNYYLFYLSGPKGIFPNRFLTYIVHDGKLEPNNPDGSVAITTVIKDNSQYDVHVEVKGSRVFTQITPGETGKAENLGFFDDPKNTYTYGGIGFRTVGPERFSVDDLFVQPK